MNKLFLIVLKTLLGAVVAFGGIALIIYFFIFVGPYIQALPLLARQILGFIFCSPFVFMILYNCYKFGDEVLFNKDKTSE